MATSIFRTNFPGTVKLQEAADCADYIIGLDLHKKTTAVCVISPKNPEQPVFQRKRLQNTELLSTLHRFSGRKVIACEAAYGWHQLAHALDAMHDVTFVPLDARKTASWIKTSGIKNDKIDAQVLCAACLHGGIGRLAVYRTSEHAHECTKLVRHRDSLVQQAASIKRQLAAFEHAYGPNPYTGEIPQQSTRASAMLSDLRSSLLCLKDRIASVEVMMKQESKDDTVITRLRSIPGIGPITAFALRHKVEDINRFESPARLSGYIGLSIRERQSGESTVKGKIAKTGDALIRRLLIQGAQAVRTLKPDLVPLYFPNIGQDALMAERRHRNKVVTALARKNLTFAWHIWKKEEDFDLQRYRERRSHVVTDRVPSRGAELECRLSVKDAR